MRVIIQSPSGIDREIQNVEYLNAPLSNGYPISILPNHAPLIAQISAGILKYKTNKSDFSLPTSEGILCVQNNLIRILTLSIPTRDKQR